MWATHHSFLETMYNSWKGDYSRNPISIFAAQLRNVKDTLKAWNQNVFFNIFSRVQKVEDDVILKEALFDMDPSPINREAWHLAQANFNKELKIDEIFWKQKARVKWVKDRDLNSKIFHYVIKKGKNKLFIHQIKTDKGVTVCNPNEVEQEIVSYFQALLGEKSV